MSRKTLTFLAGAGLIVGITAGLLYFTNNSSLELNSLKSSESNPGRPETRSSAEQEEENDLPEMAVQALRAGDYPGSEITIEETLSPGSNFSRYIASYQSEGNKIYGLLTVPQDTPPEAGYPAIVFLHGYIPPDQYRTTERYVEYQAGLARNGFVTYKIDLRGHADSEGEPVNGHFSEAYVIDTLNAVSSLQLRQDVDAEKIGIWGHSNGGEIGLRSMVVSDEIKAGVFWAGVVGSFEDMLETYNSDIPFLNLEEREVPELIKEQGLPSENPEFWNQIDPYSFLSDISGPIQLHHGTADDSVPVELSQELETALEAANKEVELYEYPGGDHNLGSPDFTPAMNRTVEFFEQYLSS